MSTDSPDDEHFNVPIAPHYPFNEPGEAIDLYTGPIDGVADATLEGTVRLVPFPSPTLRWRADVPHTEGRHPTIERVGDGIELTAGGTTGKAMVTSTSFDSVAGSSTNLEFQSGDLLNRALVHWMNLPDYSGNATLLHVSNIRQTWTHGRLSLEVDGWSITLDGRPDSDSLFKEDVGLARYVLTHIMELRRADGSLFDVESAKRAVEALRISLSFAAGRWVAPTLFVGFGLSGGEAWRWWLAPICDPYERSGTPVINPRDFDDLQAFVKASVPKLHESDAANTIRFQMQLATQTSNLGFVENRIFSAFPAIESLAWKTLVLSGAVAKKEYGKSQIWPTGRRLREVLNRAQIPVDVDKDRTPALHQLAIERGIDGPEAVTWVRNRLIHPQDPHDGLYTRDSLVREAWHQSREYICLLLLHAIGYTGGYQSAIPPYGFLGDTVPVPWAAPPAAQDGLAAADRPRPGLTAGTGDSTVG